MTKKTTQSPVEKELRAALKSFERSFEDASSGDMIDFIATLYHIIKD